MSNDPETSLQESLKAIVRNDRLYAMEPSRWEYLDMAGFTEEPQALFCCRKDDPVFTVSKRVGLSNQRNILLVVAQCPHCQTLHYGGIAHERPKSQINLGVPLALGNTVPAHMFPARLSSSSASHGWYHRQANRPSAGPIPYAFTSPREYASDMEPLVRENRLKEVVLDENLIVAVLNGFRNMQCVSLPITDDLPEGCEVVRVYHEPQTRSIVAQVFHPSFPSIAPGAECERINSLSKVNRLKLQPIPVERESYGGMPPGYGVRDLLEFPLQQPNHNMDVELARQAYSRYACRIFEGVRDALGEPLFPEEIEGATKSEQTGSILELPESTELTVETDSSPAVVELPAACPGGEIVFKIPAAMMDATEIQLPPTTPEVPTPKPASEVKLPAEQPTEKQREADFFNTRTPIQPS